VCNEAIASGLLTDAVKNRFVYPSLDEHDKKQMLIKGALHDIDSTNEGKQYQYIENQGHGGRAIWLPCIKDDNRLSQQVTLGSLDANDESHPVLCPAEDESLKSSFGLTHKYWKGVQLNPSKLVSLVPTSEYKDFGKYYLEKKFVTEVLCKLTKEPVVEKAKPKPSAPTSSPSTQQSGFKPASVSESITAPNTSLPQNPSNATDPVKLSSGGNILINGNNITITLNWQSPFELDVIVFALNDKGKVTADENTIFYNQPNYAQGAVQLNNEQRQVHIDLRKIPTDIKTIAICAVTGIDDESARGKNFGQVSHSAINVSAQNNITFELSHVKGTETAMIFGEVYRHQNIWKFRAKGQGYAGGFKKMCDEYGAEY
jgi:tellurium resistance protein TerD